MNLEVLDADLPWELTFSYGHALQRPALVTWAGNDDNVASAQSLLLQRAMLNSLAATGRYDAQMEQAA